VSYDFDVATHLRASPEALEEWLSERGLVVEGRLASDDSMWVRRRVRGGQSLGFSVEGPFAVKLGDLADPLRAAVLAPRWLVQLHVSGDEKDIGLGRSLARYLAREFEGAVHDPQADSLVFSSAGARRFRRPQGEKRISVLQMKWLLPPRPEPGTAGQFLDALRVVPEARPKRFGDFEPFQGRVPLDDDSPFVAQWEEVLARRPGSFGSLFWKAGAPFYGGAVSFPNPRALIEPGQRQVTQVRMDVDGRALHQPRWREAIVDLFQQTAVGIEAVWGAAYLEDGWLARGRSLWADSKLVHAWEFNIVGNVWHGLPPGVSWLTWFGPAYRAKVETALGDRGTRIGTGLFLRIGDEPSLPATIQSSFPELPDELLWHYLDDSSPKGKNAPKSTAAWLPKL